MLSNKKYFQFQIDNNPEYINPDIDYVEYYENDSIVQEGDIILFALLFTGIDDDGENIYKFIYLHVNHIDDYEVINYKHSVHFALPIIKDKINSHE